ncbi:phosphoglycerate mutase [Aureimonas endophytica]|uniref:Phosphoglycerate mutase n=1 Tax=Aureimonas endophytica TaxID=2027858 RepID=A0A916ZE04_9HYPH|nr:histidine phosphatase family protein [Aureimonas endophytica]GGD90749.1 phosphoglycerate mutase [Aureimonas endophytica]
MPARLYLLCQGATRATRLAAFPADEPLEDAARVAASVAARRWPRVDAVVTSPARAARETAEALGLVHDLEPALGEVDYGAWAGRRFADVAATEPGALAAWLEDPEARPGGGGESLEELDARIGRWLDTRLASDGRMLAVTHGVVMRAVVVHILNAPLRAARSVDVQPLQMLEIGSNGRRWTIRQLSS